MKKLGFDNDAYIKMQSEKITERIATFGGKLYLEFGGKLFDDFHASRVLPGFNPDSKIRMLTQLKDDDEIVIAGAQQRRQRFDIFPRTVGRGTGVELGIDKLIVRIRLQHHPGDLIINRTALQVTAADHHRGAVIITGIALLIEMTVHIRFM